MSQFYVGVTDGSLPSNVATTYTSDSGNSATPAAHILIVSANDTTSNDTDGLRTIAGVADGLAANEIQVQITNRVQGTVTTSGAVSSNISLIDFSSAPFSGVPGVYTFEIKVAAFDAATPGAGSYILQGGIITDGTTPTIIDGNFDKIVHETAGIEGADAIAAVSGNILVIQVTGVALLDINWGLVGYYVRAI